jgi:hypothetical protein
VSQITKEMCGKSFKKVDFIDCKIIVFEVKKTAFFTSYKLGTTNFEFSWLKTFALLISKVELLI